MEIHKPKPWHGWREFLKEYLIIVVGVLTALALEQAVEAIHWSEKVEHAETQERTELGRLYLNALDRVRTETCLNARLDQLKAGLLSGKEVWEPLPPMRGISGQTAAIIVPRRDWYDQVWRSLIADGTAAHFKRERELSYAGLYTQANWLEENNRSEVAEVSALNVLQNEIPLSKDMRAQLVVRIEQEKTRVFYMVIASRQLMRSIDHVAQLDKSAIDKELLAVSNTYRACAGAGLLPAGAPPPAPETPALSGAATR
jgi:hypothetical protein